MLKGRFNFHLLAAQGKLYAVGGEGAFSEHDDIEVRANSLVPPSVRCFNINVLCLDLRSPKQ